MKETWVENISKMVKEAAAKLSNQRTEGSQLITREMQMESKVSYFFISLGNMCLLDDMEEHVELVHSHPADGRTLSVTTLRQIS